MWGTYFPRRPSSSKTPSPARPYASSSILESPDHPLHSTSTPSLHPHFLPNSPHTPAHPHSLSRVEEHPFDPSTISSTAPLVARDYAQPPASSTSSVLIIPHPTSPNPPPIQLQPPPPPKRKNSISPPRLIPPASIHDTYLSTVLPSTRPPIPRSSTAPTQPQLLPSALPSPTTGAIEGKPIFEIFNAELGAPAEEMMGVLKGHLKEVLKAQEEVGRLHLGLEGLVGVSIDGNEGDNGNLPSGASKEGQSGAEEEDQLALREKGVEEIMAKLGNLSQQLRTYHRLGTPQLSFPQVSHSTATTPLSPPPRRVSQSRNPKPTSPSPSPARSRIAPLSPNPPGRWRRPPTAPSPSSLAEKVPSQPSDEPPATSRASPISPVPRNGNSSKRNSNLSPLSLSTSRADSDYDSNNLTGEEGVKGVEPLGMGFTHVPQSASARGGRREGWENEGIELVNRSRPW